MEVKGKIHIHGHFTWCKTKVRDHEERSWSLRSSKNTRITIEAERRIIKTKSLAAKTRWIKKTRRIKEIGDWKEKETRGWSKEKGRRTKEERIRRIRKKT